MSDTFFKCPRCGGYHFNVSVCGMLVCTSRIMGECLWHGHMKQNPELIELERAYFIKPIGENHFVEVDEDTYNIVDDKEGFVSYFKPCKRHTL